MLDKPFYNKPVTWNIIRKTEEIPCRNLATLDMNDVAEGFRKSQIEEIKQKQAEGPVKGNEEPNVINGLNL